MMQIKTNWTFNDYLDVYTLDDGTALDVFIDNTHSVEDFPEWVQPTSIQNSYELGAKVSHSNLYWISNVNNNISEPKPDEPSWSQTVNMAYHAINRIRANCEYSCGLLNNIYGSELSFSAYDSVAGILPVSDMSNLETIIKTLCDATGQDFETKTWINGSPIYASDLNRFEKPFLLLNEYQNVYDSIVPPQTAEEQFRVRRCGVFECDDNTARYGG